MHQSIEPPPQGKVGIITSYSPACVTLGGVEHSLSLLQVEVVWAGGSNDWCINIAMFRVMSPFVINVPTRDLLVNYTKWSCQIGTLALVDNCNVCKHEISLLGQTWSLLGSSDKFLH